MVNVLLVSDMSGQKGGGVPVFNMKLARGLVEAGHTTYLLVVQPDAGTTLDDLRQLHQGVTVAMVPYRPPDQEKAPPDWLRRLLDEKVASTEPQDLDQPLPMTGGTQSMRVVIGHSRFSGGAARQIVQKWYPEATYVHILHTPPREQAIGKGIDLAVGLDNAWREHGYLLDTAKLGVGVGRLLADTVTTLAHEGPWHTQAHELVPGCNPARNPVEPKPDRADGDPFNVLLVGRADDPVKGLTAAVGAVLLANWGFERDGKSHPKSSMNLRVLGVPAAILQQEQARVDLMCGIQPGQPNPYVTILAYSDQAGFVTDTIRAADAVIMPSRVEGFGLVALEALEQGVPVLVTERSGVARFLLDRSRVDPAQGGPCVVRDQDETTFDSPTRPWQWAEALVAMKADLAARYAGARTLWGLLGRYRWMHAAQALVAAAEVAPSGGDTRQGADGVVEPLPS